jgi:hypothetical protein
VTVPSFTTLYDVPVFGTAWSLTPGPVEGSNFGVADGTGLTLSDGDVHTGYQMLNKWPPIYGTQPTESQLLVGQVAYPLEVTPAPIPSDAVGHAFIMTVALSDGDTFAAPPPAVVGADATLHVTLSHLTGSMDSLTIATFLGSPVPMVTGETEWMDVLLGDGLGIGIDAGVVTTELLGWLNDGSLVPTVIYQAATDRELTDPLFLVAELGLVIGDFDVADELVVPPPVRGFPRDDALGLGSAPRIHPPSRAGRLAGGYQ